METFEGKFALYQRQLQDELSRVMRDESSRIIDELNRGPHDKIKDKELREIWKEMRESKRHSQTQLNDHIPTESVRSLQLSTETLQHFRE